MKKYLNTPALILSGILTIVLEVLMNQNKVELATRLVGGLIFLVLNYIVLAFILTALVRIFRILRLPDVRLKSYAYYLYPVALLIAYAGFLLVMVRLADVFFPAYQLAGVIIAGVAALIAAQLGGAFPGARISQKKQALRLENAGGSLGGFEILGSLIGEYRDGFVLGLSAIPYGKVDRMHRSKDSIIIEGAGEPKLELIIVSERAQNYFIELLAERLKTSRALLESGIADKPKAGLLKSGAAPVKAAEHKRAKPVKLIEAQKKNSASKNPQAGSTVKAGRPVKTTDQK